MESIEFIEIRLTQNLNDVLEKELWNVIQEVMKKKSGYTMKLYHKMHLESDYLIIIFHTQKITGHKGSELGLRLKESLKDLGIINHSVWNERL